MRKKFKISQNFAVVLTTAFLFVLAIGYYRLRTYHFLAEKKVFPRGLPELKEHNQTPGSLALQTIRFSPNPTAVLGTADQQVLDNLRLKILNASATPGLAVAAKNFFLEKGLTSIAVGLASMPETASGSASIEFAPGKREPAELIRYLIGQNLEVEMRKIEETASDSANSDFDIILTLATSSAIFKPYF